MADDRARASEYRRRRCRGPVLRPHLSTRDDLRACSRNTTKIWLGSAATSRLAASASGRRGASGQRLWHRLPWLIVGLAGAMLSVAIVSGFEQELNEEVLLAFFLPSVIYMADAVGTQTEAILIRAMSAGVTVRSVFVRELATGAILGGLVGATFLVFALVTFGDAEIALAVAVALFASCSIASVVAMTLPWALASAGRDPAFGAGPLATVIQDLLSIVVYFAVATAIAV